MRGFARVCFVGLVLAAANLACNLSPSSSDIPPIQTTAPLEGSGRPAVLILEPANGAQVVVKQQVLIKVQAVDSAGITRVELLRDGKPIVLQPSPDAAPNFEAILPFTPSEVGAYSLQVVAYRRNLASEPAVLTLQAVNASGSGAPSVTTCTARVNVNNLNLRGGPGTNFQVLDKLSIGEQLSVTGRNADTSWLRVRRISTDGWVSAQYASLEGDCTTVGVVQ